MAKKIDRTSKKDKILTNLSFFIAFKYRIRLQYKMANIY